MEPVFPNDSLAMSGNDRSGLRDLASGTEPGMSGERNGESLNVCDCRGSPFSSRPIKMDVLHVMIPNDNNTNEPPNQPALLKTNGSPSNPTPYGKRSGLNKSTTNVISSRISEV